MEQKTISVSIEIPEFKGFEFDRYDYVNRLEHYLWETLDDHPKLMIWPDSDQTSYKYFIYKELPKKYSFPEALTFVRKGKKIRRKGWGEGIYLAFIDSYLSLFPSAQGIILPEQYYDATDWEVMEEGN